MKSTTPKNSINTKNKNKNTNSINSNTTKSKEKEKIPKSPKTKEKTDSQPNNNPPKNAQFRGFIYRSHKTCDSPNVYNSKEPDIFDEVTKENKKFLDFNKYKENNKNSFIPIISISTNNQQILNEESINEIFSLRRENELLTKNINDLYNIIQCKDQTINELKTLLKAMEEKIRILEKEKIGNLMKNDMFKKALEKIIKDYNVEINAGDLEKEIDKILLKKSCLIKDKSIQKIESNKENIEIKKHSINNEEEDKYKIKKKYESINLSKEIKKNDNEGNGENLVRMEKIKLLCDQVNSLNDNIEKNNDEILKARNMLNQIGNNKQ